MSRRPKPSCVIIDGDIAFIQLNNAPLAAVIDASDTEMVAGHAWRSHANGSGHVYASTKIGGRTTFLHRLLMSPASGMVVDHIDGDGLNCRRVNMRVCTGAQNLQNRRIRSDKFKGVHKHSGRELWYAAIRGKKIGYFKTPVQAAIAYDSAAREVFGQFAKTNF